MTAFQKGGGANFPIAITAFSNLSSQLPQIDTRFTPVRSSTVRQAVAKRVRDSSVP